MTAAARRSAPLRSFPPAPEVISPKHDVSTENVHHRRKEMKPTKQRKMAHGVRTKKTAARKNESKMETTDRPSD